MSEKYEKLDALARAFMDIRPDLPQMSLDEWLLEHFEHLSETEQKVGFYILRLYDEKENVMQNREECWIAACKAVVEAAKNNPKNTGLQYAASYASVGSTIASDDNSRHIQAIYILNNLSHWRGDEAKGIKALLKTF